MLHLPECVSVHLGARDGDALRAPRPHRQTRYRCRARTDGPGAIDGAGAGATLPASWIQFRIEPGAGGGSGRCRTSAHARNATLGRRHQLYDNGGGDAGSAGRPGHNVETAAGDVCRVGKIFIGTLIIPEMRNLTVAFFNHSFSMGDARMAISGDFSRRRGRPQTPATHPSRPGRTASWRPGRVSLGALPATPVCCATA